MTLNDIIEPWKEHKKRQVKPTSFSAYMLIWEKIIRPELGDTDLSVMNKKFITHWVYSLMDGGKSKKYCTDILIVWKMMMRYASEEYDVLIPDTNWKMQWPTVNGEGEEELARYTQAESKKIIDYLIQNPSPKNLGILISLCTGLRIGEVCGLKWEDIDIGSRTIRVERTVERIYDVETRKTRIIISTPKTRSSRRSVPIAAQILPVLRNFKKTYRDDYYVCTCSEDVTEPRTFRNYYRHTVLNKVKLNRCIKFHGLRHTFASTLIENKVDVKTTSVILGHADVSTTMNIYVHPTDDAKRDAVRSGLKNLFK